MADSSLPNAPFVDVPDAPFDTTKAAPVAPFAQSAARHATESQTAKTAASTISSNPGALSLSSQITNRAHTTTDTITNRLVQQSPQLQATQATTNSALNRIGIAGTMATMGINEQLRIAAGDTQVKNQVKRIIQSGGGGIGGEQLDALGALLGPNDIGETDFWTQQPGMYDRIMQSHPTTPQGALMQMLLGMRADFARWKQGHPIVKTGETAALGFLDPTAWVTGGVVARGVGGTAKFLGEFGKTAQAAARTSETVKLPNVPLEFSHTATVREGPHETSTTTTVRTPPPTKGTVAQTQRVAAAIGRNFPQTTKQLGAAYQKLASVLHSDAPIVGNRFYAAGQEYGPSGEWAHNKMVNDHANLPTAVATRMLSNDFFGGLNRQQKIDLVGAIEDLPNTLSGKKDIPPGRKVPIQGVSIQQRAENWSNYQINFLSRLQKLAPKTYALMMKPETWANYEEGFQEPFMGPQNPNAKQLETPGGTIPSEVSRAAPHFAPADENTRVTPLQASTWFPRGGPNGLYDRTGKAPGVSASGQQGAYGLNVKRRTMGTLEEIQKPQPVTDLTGRIIGRRPGMQFGDQLNAQWDPETAATRKQIMTENYLLMHEHVHDGKGVISPRTGKAAVLDIPYVWHGERFDFPGGNLWHGAPPIDGRNLERTIQIGSGQTGAAAADKFARQVAPFWAAKHNITDADAYHRVIDHLVSDFRKANPTHIVEAGKILQTPDLDGLAVEGTYLQMVGDANPVLKWLGTGMSVGRRIPGEVGEFTHFQTLKAFPGGVMSGVEPSAMQKLHFAGLEDDVIGDHASYLRAYDQFTNFVKMAKLAAPGYHNVWNVHPAMTNLLLETAGSNPIKMARYNALLDAATFGQSIPHAFSEGLQTARDLMKGGNLMGHKTSTGGKWDVPKEWMEDAKKYQVTSRGSYGTGIPIDQYVHLFSTPWDGLTGAEKFQRAAAAASHWNQNLTFNVMEARQVATAFHILKDEEHMDPKVAARTINKAINDYNNLTDIERNPILQRVYWFYAFKKMMMRQAAVSLATHANVLGTESRTIQQWNQSQGDPQAGDRAIVWGKDSSGNSRLMSTSMAPIRFGLDIAGLTGVGGEHDWGLSAWPLIGGTLSPLTDFGFRLGAQMYRSGRKQSTTPKPWDPATGLWDVYQPLEVKIRQSLQSLGSDIAPIPMGLMPTTYTGLQPKQYGALSAASTDLRNVVRYMSPEQQRAAMALVERMDNGDLTALIQAKAMYSFIERTRPKMRGSY